MAKDTETALSILVQERDRWNQKAVDALEAAADDVPHAMEYALAAGNVANLFQRTIYDVSDHVLANPDICYKCGKIHGS